MAVGALGVVFGDLGTSPLYTMPTVVDALGGHAGAAGALGALSLIVWTLLITISLKYCAFVMRADNQGEGGILALMSLVGMNDWKPATFIGASMGLLGAALIYGDGIITPSISVLSALEGVKVVTRSLTPYILPLACAILLAVFAFQRFGTSVIGKTFGPIMLTWFLTIGVLGFIGIVRHPVVLEALNPIYGARLLITSGPSVLLILGAVFLCATGGEALYADMGSFGRFPIRLAWYAVVLPSLLLSYAGQVGLMLSGMPKGSNPFFLLAPGWAVIPLVVLATLATIIASQAIITGSFSMTRQAMQLGWLPAFDIRQTSDKAYGQIYVPVVNAMMAAGTLAVTLAFRSSDKLAGAYGTAVSTTMVLTTLLLIRAMARIWRWPMFVVAPFAAVFLIVDVAFFSANLLKIADGGWIPLTLGLCIYTVMVTWRTGVLALRRHLATLSRPTDDFIAQLGADGVPRVPGTAVFLTRPSKEMPGFIINYVRKMGSLHENVITLNVKFEEQPRVEEGERSSVDQIAPGFWRVRLRYGFLEIPDMAAALDGVRGLPPEVDLKKAIFFAARDIVSSREHGWVSKWRVALFSFLFRNGVRLVDRFNLPADRTIEIARPIVI